MATQRSASPACLVVAILGMPLTYDYHVNILGHLCLYELTSPSEEVSCAAGRVELYGQMLRHVCRGAGNHVLFLQWPLSSPATHPLLLLGPTVSEQTFLGVSNTG